jgi:hypothetical protein
LLWCSGRKSAVSQLLLLGARQELTRSRPAYLSRGFSRSTDEGYAARAPLHRRRRGHLSAIRIVPRPAYGCHSSPHLSGRGLITALPNGGHCGGQHQLCCASIRLSLGHFVLIGAEQTMRRAADPHPPGQTSAWAGSLTVRSRGYFVSSQQLRSKTGCSGRVINYSGDTVSNGTRFTEFRQDRPNLPGLVP